jgi:hypothetical protein
MKFLTFFFVSVGLFYLFKFETTRPLNSFSSGFYLDPGPQLCFQNTVHTYIVEEFFVGASILVMLILSFGLKIFFYPLRRFN